ncbi:MAG: anthranilate phosphoribosyltransferase [Gemmatimonadales bacterium]
MSSNTDALNEAIRKLATRQDLSAAETEAAFSVVMDGHASDVQKTALLVGLRAKGETPQEVAGGVRALGRAMVVVKVPDPDAVVDTCGTGGGSLTTFNISTAAAFALAGAGVPVAKHGNRSFSSKCGSADVLEALGIQLPLTPQRMEAVFARAGLSFLFAPRLHPAMRHVGPVRQELGVPTIMNILGPLTNPAGARRQVVGVADPKLLNLVAEALRELGHIRALVVHGEPGMDEFSPVGATRGVRVEDGTLEEFVFDPVGELGWTGLQAADLAGGDPPDNARVIEQVLAGKGTRTARAAVVLNTAAGLYVAGFVENLVEGVDLAESALDEKKGWEALERVREVTRSEA